MITVYRHYHQSKPVFTNPAPTPEVKSASRPLSGLIVTQLKTNRIAEAIATLRKPANAQREVDLKAFNILLHNLAKLPPYCSSLGPFSQEGVKSVMDEVLAQMRRRNLTPDAFSYSSLLRWCLDHNMLHRFDSIWSKMVEIDKITPDDALLRLRQMKTNMTSAKTSKQKNQPSEENTSGNKQPSSGTWGSMNLSSVIVANLKGNKIPEAIEFLRTHPRKVVDEQAYSILIKVVSNIAEREVSTKLGKFASEGIAGVVESIVADMRRRKVKGNEYTYATLMQYYLDTKQTAKFDKTWEEMTKLGVKPDTLNFNLLLRRQSLPGMAYGSFSTAVEEMRKYEIQPNDETLSQLLRIQARTGQPENAITLLQELAKSDVVMTPNLLSAIIEILCRQYGEEIALNTVITLSKTIKPTPDVFNTILISLIRRASLLGYDSASNMPHTSSSIEKASWSDLAVEYDDNLQILDSVAPNSANFTSAAGSRSSAAPSPTSVYQSEEYMTALTSNYRKLQADFEEILSRTFVEMRNLGLVPNHKTYLHLLTIYSQLRDQRRFKDTFEMMEATFGPIKTRIEFEIVLNFYAHSRLAPEVRHQQVNSILARMRQLGLSPDSKMYSTLISKAIYEQDIAKAKAWLQEMKSAGLAFDVKTLKPLLIPLSKRGLVDQYFKVLEYFEQTDLGYDLKIYRLIHHETIRVLCNGGQVPRAFETLLDYEQKGYDPDILTYNLVLEACVRGQDFAKAKQVLASITRRYIVPNSKTLALEALVPK